MKPDQSPQISDTPPENGYDQPVAYDAQGRPLYAHPPKDQPVTQYVHMSRPLEPVRQVVSESIQQKHNESAKRYPHLNLSEGEYVISHVRRHIIGVLVPIIAGAALIGIILMFLFAAPALAEELNTSFDTSVLMLPAFLIISLIALGMGIAYYVYVNNKFYLTNESVIQEIQTSLFSRLEQTVSLANIEDASYTQHGILQSIFDYGQIRLSTEGDETTYRFTYVASPKQHIATLNNAVEAFKNGRPTDSE